MDISRRSDSALTLLQLLQALEGDLKLVAIGELGGVVEYVDPQQRDDRHDGQSFLVIILCLYVRTAKAVVWWNMI